LSTLVTTCLQTCNNFCAYTCAAQASKHGPCNIHTEEPGDPVGPLTPSLPDSP
jgi:hypothetical protein